MKRREVIGIGGTLAALIGFRPGIAAAQFGDSVWAPKTWFDRAIEARSSRDIAKDNQIVLKVNKVMANLGTLEASTEIYEQRLLITGLFDDKPTYDQFESGVRAVPGVKKLYWHAAYMSEDDQEKKSGDMVGWAAGVEMTTKAKARLLRAKAVADVNYRVAGDAFATLFVLGLARSADERRRAVTTVRQGDGVKKVVDYVVVRPKS